MRVPRFHVRHKEHAMPNVRLIDLIARAESADNPFAIRFEPHVYKRVENLFGPSLNKISDIHSCSRATARMIYASSFGRFQIMGFNLYSGYLEIEIGNAFTFLNDTVKQNAAFDAYVTKAGINYEVADLISDPKKMLRFSRLYNGPRNDGIGGNYDYADRLLKVYKNMGIE